VPRIWVSALEGAGLDVLREYIARVATHAADAEAGPPHDNIAPGAQEASLPSPDDIPPRSLQA
jgi:hypothetical protein